MGFRSGNKQIIKNIFFNGLNFLVSIINGILITPLILTKLGKEPFVIIQITISVSMYANLIANSLNESLFLVLTKNEEKHKSQIYSTASFLYLIILIVSIPVIIFISYNSGYLFSLSEEFLSDSKYLIFLNLVSFLLIIITNYFTAPLYLNNRVDICQQIIASRNVMRTVLILISIYFISNSLIYIGFSYLISSIVLLFVGYVLFKKYSPDIIIDIRKYKKKLILELSSIGGWSLLFQLGALIFSYGDVLILTVFLDANSAADLTAMFQWRIVVYSVISLFLQIFHPLFLNYFKEEKIVEIKKLFLKGIGYLGVFASILCGLIFVYSYQILFFWLGEDYTHLSPILKLLIFYWSINCSFTLYKSIYLIYDKAKTIGIITISAASIHVLLSVFLIKVFNMGIYSIVFSSMFVTLIQNIILYPVYSVSFSKIKLTEIYLEIFKIILAFLIVLIVHKLIGFFMFRLDSILNYLIEASLIGFISLSIIVLLFIKKEEKIKIKSKLWK